MGSDNAQANSVLEAVEQEKKNNQKYSDFVTNARQERSLSKKGTAENSLFPTNYDPFTDINLGLDSDQLDTDAPEPLVPRQAEPLFLLNSGQSEVVVKPKIWSQLSDTNTLVKHKYKPNATTAIEQKEVRAQLNPNEISLISIGTRHIDFGRETIIPPGAMAGFDIIFTSDNAQNFTGQIIVQVNGNNLFNVTIAADIIPISLELPVNELFLQHQSLCGRNIQHHQSWKPPSQLPLGNGPDFSPRQLLHRRASGAAPASQRHHTQLVHQRGRGHPDRSSGPCSSRDHPRRADDHRRYRPFDHVDCQHGAIPLQAACHSVENLRIIGEVSEGRAEFVEKQIEFGAFAVGSEITKHATLKNQSKSTVCFFVEKTDPSLSVVPLTGTIPIGGQILLAVTINSSSRASPLLLKRSSQM
ncbi:hypothetical protein BLNAU_16729 [Blattamonas nauphoetae]|uniref:HYDIN/VesB/CFA65-like Ig-like domain-containing protein n=1 Tax=Blattamonas nauphoetae TaxID=2049346 RepID=A0ABQ9X837_9EUKA|nr:hypothetical protein BLNAU_16729 [Blattamonas nauphoetae]